jgi:class 3 adenylate cyclase
MPGPTPERRLVTFLFLDVVGSTSLAADLGDRRWRDLLQRFRRIVQRQVKTHGGTEQDWAGDGLFATFPDPARAVRAAVAIADAVHEVGVDVRCGVHTGEAEVVDGKLAGLGVHLAARVMSLGGGAEVLVSGTVRDVMTGSSVTFEDRGMHELKGVPEARAIYRVAEVDGKPAPEALAPEVVAARVGALEALHERRPSRTAALVAGGAVGMVAVLIVVLAAMQGDGNTTPPGSGGAQGPVTLVALDANDGRTITTLHDEAFSEHLWGILSVEDGNLWQATPDELVQRDPADGSIQNTIPLPAGWEALDGGLEYVWAAAPYVPGTIEVHRISPLSGQDRSVKVDLDLADMAFGNGSLWLLGSDGTLDEMNPISMKVVHRYDSGAVYGARIVPIAGYVWICECQIGRVAQFDPRKGRIVNEQTLPEHGFIFGVESSSSPIQRVWLLDPDHNTLTPLDATTGAPGTPIGIGGARITDATIVGDEMWVASQTEVTRIDLTDNFRQHPFEVPEGVSAGSVAPTPDGKMVWVANCGCPIEH